MIYKDSNIKIYKNSDSKICRLEFSVMLELLLTSKKSVKVFSESIGKTITALEISDNKLCFTFSNTSKMNLFDDEQFCCENRYMNTDDNLDSFIGSSLQGAEIRDVFRNVTKKEGIYDSAFLVVSTSTGQFTVVIHNEHNGHYGGFLIKAERGGNNK